MISAIRKFIRLCLNIEGFIFNHNNKSKIVYHHDISKTYTDMGTDFSLFKDQIKAIEKSGFRIVDYISEDKNQVMLAFDDGWRGIYEQRSYFFQNGYKPTIFIAVELIGQPGYLTLEEIKELKDMGFIFESHTWSHNSLTIFDNDKDLRHELYDSKIEIESLLNTSVQSLCFPQGKFSKDIVKQCKECGYKYIYSSLNGSFNDLDKESIICRNLFAELPANQVKFVLKGTSLIYRSRLRKLHYKA